MTNANSAAIPTRPFGTTGEEVSLLGLGGAHIGNKLPEKDSIRLMHMAFDAGVSFLVYVW